VLVVKVLTAVAVHQENDFVIVVSFVADDFVTIVLFVANAFVFFVATTQTVEQPRDSRGFNATMVTKDLSLLRDRRVLRG
jgi:hypothetical protein